MSIERYYASDFTTCQQEWQDDGSVILTFSRHDDAAPVSLHVFDLYGPDEEVLAELVLSEVTPPHLRARLLEATKHARPAALPASSGVQLPAAKPEPPARPDRPLPATMPDVPPDNVDGSDGQPVGP